MASNIEQVVIHAGFRKTGTSTIQVLFSRLASGIVSLPVEFWYPKTGRLPEWPHAHHGLLAMLTKDPVATLSELKQEAAAQPSSRAVISCEDLSITRNLPLLQYFRQAFPNAAIKMVFFVRDHDRWIESMYGEDVKRGRTLEDAWDYARRKMTEHSFLRQVNRAREMLPDADIQIRLFTSKSIINDGLDAILNLKNEKPITIWENAGLTVHMTMLLRELYRSPAFDPSKILNYIDTAYKLEPIIDFPTDFGYLSHDQRVSLYEAYYEETMTISRDFLKERTPFWTPDKQLRHYRDDPHYDLRAGLLRFFAAGFPVHGTDAES